jgi:hypothetical protein
MRDTALPTLAAPCAWGLGFRPGRKVGEFSCRLNTKNHASGSNELVTNRLRLGPELDLDRAGLADSAALATETRPFTRFFLGLPGNLGLTNSFVTFEKNSRNENNSCFNHHAGYVGWLPRRVWTVRHHKYGRPVARNAARRLHAAAQSVVAAPGRNAHSTG